MKNRVGFLNIKISISALVRPMSRKDVLLAGSVERINIPDPVDKLRQALQMCCHVIEEISTKFTEVVLLM